MKKIVTLFIFVCISINMCAQIKIDNNKKTIIDNLISGMTYPNISIDNDKNFYLVNSNECKTGNLLVLKLGNREEALGTLEFFQSFIKNEDAGTFVEIEDESTGYKYRLFRVNLMGQGGIRFENLDKYYECASVLFIKIIKSAVSTIETYQEKK